MATLELLTQHTWPGNVRELENAIQYAAILCPNDKITPDFLPDNAIRGFDRLKEEKEAVQVWNQIDTTASSGDFLNQDIYKQLIPIIQDWRNGSYPPAEMQIQTYLSMRLTPSLTEKKLREDRLLWKRKN